jgi:hypothetical protein
LGLGTLATPLTEGALAVDGVRALPLVWGPQPISKPANENAVRRRTERRPAPGRVHMVRIVEHECLRANPDFREYQQIDYGEPRQSQTTRAGLRRD